jgi:hypothetical protein
MIEALRNAFEAGYLAAHKVAWDHDHDTPLSYQDMKTASGDYVVAQERARHYVYGRTEG